MMPYQARQKFSELIEHAFTLSGAEFAEALDFNAELATALRDIGIAKFLWKVDKDAL